METIAMSGECGGAPDGRHYWQNVTTLGDETELWLVRRLPHWWRVRRLRRYWQRLG